MRAELADVKPAYAGWCKLYVATIRLPDGRTFTREIEDHGRATAMLPFDPVRRTAIVIRQLRAPALYVGRPDHLIVRRSPWTGSPNRVTRRPSSPAST